MKLSKHATRRKSQRGLHDLEVDLVLFAGEIEHAPGGATRRVLTAKKVKAMHRALDRIPRGAAAVEGGDGQVLTCYKLFRN